MIITAKQTEVLIDGVVDTNAIGIKRRGIGISHGERGRQAIGIEGSVRQRESRHQWLVSRRDVLASCRCIEVAGGGLRQQQPQALIGKEEESTISDEGAPERSAEVILAE